MKIGRVKYVRLSKQKVVKQKRNSIKSPFFNLLLDYIPIKEEALSSLYDANLQIIFRYCKAYEK